MYELMEGGIPEKIMCDSFDEFKRTYYMFRQKEEFKNAFVYPVMEPQYACFGVVLCTYVKDKRSSSNDYNRAVHLCVSFTIIQSERKQDLFKPFQECARQFDEVIENIFKKLDKEVNV